MISFDSSDIPPVLTTPGPFTDKAYTPEYGISSLEETKVLVIGAGGLGCEIIKDLTFSGFKQIEVIDMDTIELSNLNRQFLFRVEDIGKSKSEIAVNYIKKLRCGGIDKSLQIKSHFNKIQDFDDGFYQEFDIVICGLDNIEARKWINKKLIDIANNGKIIPMIDGGTEGFQGSLKVIIPTVTSCFECYNGLLTEDGDENQKYPLCTLASTPRLPEHCIEWVHQLEWEKLYPDIELDADNDEHINKVYQLALERSLKFNIQGVTKSLTLGVIKNIIPSIASTNSIIASACSNEAFKFVTCCSPFLQNTMYYNGENGVQAISDPFDKNPNCEICGNLPIEIEIKNQLDMKLVEFIELVNSKFNIKLYKIFTVHGDLYNQDQNEDKGNGNQQSKLIDLLNVDKDSDGIIYSKNELIILQKGTDKVIKLIPQFIND
ncbi:unnamed protein product [[Candida] boidinii]|uniref:NEDD8-activating enzyme E1 catalytic subunit n=1 Tax=Candida boidinii TaxID=5477 RepID=A0A9W6T582_CANBO|nr:hypothetical protein B5S30_g3109 [[Candida] boidinii]GME77257.1 unnamed protein product [[Candida] boidinii]GMF99503.1 unnamed protein product [[Candida] boidinii]